jgi:mRNA-degrading endonuclease RelE of RelBE toxin-antitoxin system
VIASDKFDREIKRLYNKYASLADEVDALEEGLRANPTKGTPIGRSCYKIRIAVKSKGRGKSSGARVITYYYIHGNTVYLLSIYDKSERVTVSDSELAELLASVADA